MTRKRKRDIERRVADLEEVEADDKDDIEQPAVIYEDPLSGEYYTERGGGERFDPEASDADMLIVMSDAVCMSRERAEREGREILGPAKDAPPGNDVVRVSWRNDPSEESRLS